MKDSSALWRRQGPYAPRVLFVAIAFCVLAVLCGLVIVGRSAIGASRRLARLDEAVTTGAALAVRAQELRTRAERVRSDVERLYALARLGS